METKLSKVLPEGSRINRRGWEVRLQLQSLPQARFSRNCLWGQPNSRPRVERVLAGARGLTSLAHATGAHHGNLDQAAARGPQAAIGCGCAALGGVLGDGAHVLNEAHRRFSRDFTAGNGTCRAGRGSHCATAAGGPGRGLRG